MVYKVIFDLDDTLVESGRCYNRQLQKFAEFVQANFPDVGSKEEILDKYDQFDRQAIRENGFCKEHFPESMATTWEYYCEKFGQPLEPEKIKQCLLIGWEVYRLMPEAVPAMRDVLNELKEKFELILYTMGDVEVQQKKIQHHGLRSWFNEIHIVPRKTRETLASVLKPEVPEQTAIIGDSIRGEIKPALELGARPIHLQSDFPWSYHEVSVSENFPSVSSLPEVFEFLP